MIYIEGGKKKKREEVEKNSRSRSKLIEIKGICARSPPINNFAGVQQQQPERKRGRGEEKKRKGEKKKWSRRHSGLRSNIYSAATYYATRDSIARSRPVGRVEPPPRSDLDDRSSSELMEPPLCIKRGPLYNYITTILFPPLLRYSKIPSRRGSRETDVYESVEISRKGKSIGRGGGLDVAG